MKLPTSAVCRVLLPFFLVLSVHSSGAVESLDSIAAIVNDDVILISEIRDRYLGYLEQVQAQGLDESSIPPRDVIISQIVERLVIESIQLQEAAARGIVISDEELAEGIKRYAESVQLTPEFFREELESQGVDYREFREDMRRQLILNRVQQTIVAQRIYISMQDIREFRASPIFQELASEEFRLGHILLSVSDTANRRVLDAARQKASEIVTELRDGANFGNMAVAHSSANTALDGGDLGWRKVSQVPSLFSGVVQELEVGQTADPIENALGIHIIQLLEKRGASTQRGLSTHVRHILIQPSTILPEDQARDLANDLRQRILDGESFSNLAIEYSDDPGTALAGGDLGWTSGQNFVDEFRTAMDATPVGQISDVFKSEFGFHILEVLDQREEDLTEDALNNIAYQELFNQRFEETHQAWIKEIRDQAYVKMIQEIE